MDAHKNVLSDVQTYRRTDTFSADYFCKGYVNDHEGLGKNVKSGERQKYLGMDGASEAPRDIWSLQAPECIGAANQPSCQRAVS